MNNALTSLIRGELLHMEGVRKLPPARRFASLLTSETAAESVLFLESGFVKVVRRGEDAKEVILSIIGPGEIFAEHALLHRVPRPFTAEILQEGVIYEIPREVFITFCRQRPEVWQMLWEIAVKRQLEAEQKMALFCLEDVEFRILYYLGKLAPQFAGPATDQEEYSLPLSQGELASLVGATRETTSTTLNTLSRKGVVRLSRRLVTVRSLEALRSASRHRAAKAAAQAGGGG
jgi:CRP/FNR family transcriptional regulator